jgi:CRP-like cAMP-binding protein
MSNLSDNKSTEAPVIFKAGTVIFAQGRPSKYLYLVKKGEVILLKANGQKLTGIQICKEKDILNEVAILTNKPNTLSAVAKTDVELMLVDQKDIMISIKSAPKWIPEIFSTLCERLQHTQEMIEEHNLAGEKDARLLVGKEDEKKYLQAIASYNS